MQLFDDQVAVITGGTGAPGRSLTRLFVAAGGMIRVLLGGMVAASGIVGAMTYAAAATPRLSFPCSPPTSAATVTCRLTGSGFIARERVSIVYRVTVGTSTGRSVTMLYRRTGLTSGTGTLTRPPFWFTVDPRVLTYRVMVTVTGARVDRAAVTAAGTP